MSHTIKTNIIDIAEHHFNSGNLDEAEQNCNLLIKKEPENVEALFLLGNISAQRGNQEGAFRSFYRAVSISPNLAVLRLNLGISLRMMQRHDESIEEFNKAVALDPEYTSAWFQLGAVLEESNKLPEALDAYAMAIELDPLHSEAIQRTGDVYQRQNRLDEALEYYWEAIRVKPDNFVAYNNAGGVLKYLGRASEALDSYRKALEIKPDLTLCASNYLLTILLAQESTPAETYEAHVEWSESFEKPLVSHHKPHTNNPEPNRPLRIGYVSTDFKYHPVAFFIEPILASHNREDFSVYCYSNCDSPDMISTQLEKLGDVWRPINHLSDEDVCDLVRNDNIDILVDLGGHTSKNRLTVFARKPAPIQVTWLGYPATTGLKSIDYRITDAAADPPGYAERFHSETLVHLPENFICYRPPANSPPVAPLPCLKNGFVTFGVFNHFAKITQNAVDLWCHILRTIPDAKFLIKARGIEHEPMRDKVKEMFASRGISAERLILVGQTPTIYSHLELLGEVDISLDTFPYNGTTTTCESLWMGVPVIAKEGDSHVSRVSVSLLGAVGLSGLVATSDEDYVALAIFLASDTSNLEILRNNLRDRMRKSKLLDTKGFTRNLEGAYREMWHRWCVKQGKQKT